MTKLEFHFQQKNIEYLKHRFSDITDFNEANDIISEISGQRDFFPEQCDYLSFLELLKTQRHSVRDGDRREYGDFQTPDRLADEVCTFIKGSINPKVLVEPTFGKGSFIISALKSLPSLNYIFGVEIHEKYVWHSKFRVQTPFYAAILDW